MVLQQCCRRSSARNRGPGGDVRLKSGEPAAVPTAVGVHKTEIWLGPPHYRKYIATREISTCPGEKSAVFTMCYACTRGDRAVYLLRAGPGAMGHRRCLKGYDRGVQMV